jgi:parallel beta-helix repeat protein
MSTLTLALKIQPVRADGIGTIYVNADGSITPSTAPISTVDNITYTFTGNISEESIVVQRNSIVLDGAGYVLQGSGPGDGVNISGPQDVTVRNMTITGFSNGIELNGSSGDMISGNTLMNNSADIILYSSSDYNLISENDVESNINDGIYLLDSSNNTVCGNIVTNGSWGIALDSSNCNSVSENIVTANKFMGIYLGFSSYNSIFKNNITNNFDGFWLVSASSNMIFHNNIIDNTYQIGHIEESSNTWDDGYPAGGNYWSDSSTVDVYKGPYQNQTGSDGIADTPYVVGVNNTDNYPLVHPWSFLPVHNIRTGLAYSAIQDAINASETSDGDTIFVESGTYFENLVVNKSVALIGENMATVLDGGGQETVIHIMQNNVTVTGFTIQNGYTIENSGEGVFLDDVSGCQITQNNITGNGDGVFGYGDDNIINDNFIDGNQLRGVDLGYYGHDLTGNAIVENVIDDNSYFGIQMVYGIQNVIIQNNITNQNVGLEIYGASGPQKISQQNTVSDNIFDSNGLDIYLYGLPDLIGPTNNTIVDNTLGTICIEPGQNNVIYHNNFLSANPVTACDGNNTWDLGYPSGGNYWKNYNGTDQFSGAYQNVTGSDGIGDTQYAIASNNTDHYPLAAPIAVLDVGTWNGTALNAEVIRNSTLLNVQVDVANRTVILTFPGPESGPETTSGFCRIAMPNAIVQNLWNGSFTVLLNNASWPFKNWTDTANTYMYLSYTLQFPNVTYYSGDLIVNGSQTLLIDNCEFDITGRLIISDQAQVSIRNCTFISNWNLSEEPDLVDPGISAGYYWRTRQIIVESNGKLNISDSNIMLLTPTNISYYYQVQPGGVYYHAIAAYDEAEITMTNSTLSWNGNWQESGNSGVYLYDNSSLVLSNSSISTFQNPIGPEDYEALAGTAKNFVFALNTTAVYASDSIIDEVYTNQYANPGNTTIQLTNSTGDYIEIDGSTSYVHLTNSTIGWILSYATAHVWLNNSTVTAYIDDEDRTQESFYSLSNSKVGTLYPYGEIQLDNSKVTTFDPQTARAVYVVWHLPLLGQVLIPYALAPYVIPILIVLLIAFSATGIMLTFHFKHRRTEQTLNQSPTLQETPTQEQ